MPVSEFSNSPTERLLRAVTAAIEARPVRPELVIEVLRDPDVLDAIDRPLSTVGSTLTAVGRATFSARGGPVLQVLLDHGANPDGAGERLALTPTVMICVENLVPDGRLEQVLRAGANPNRPNAKGLLPLVQLLVQNPFTSVNLHHVQLLIDAGASWTLTDRRGNSAMKVAQEDHLTEVIELFVAHEAKLLREALPSNREQTPSPVVRRARL